MMVCVSAIMGILKSTQFVYAGLSNPAYGIFEKLIILNRIAVDGDQVINNTTGCLVDFFPGWTISKNPGRIQIRNWIPPGWSY
jgi:hypothetical protein